MYNTVDCYRAIAYYRLSEKDKDKAVSDSIENQKKLVREYVAREGNIELIDELYDDGYTGTNFDRPGFSAVLKAAQHGEVDCIIVKDLSRLGREYIETGKYLERIFPSLGVRVIAINDDYDSSDPKPTDNIMLPVKNLINETYCRDQSSKLRKQFKVQREHGEYIGAFASYGYCKSPEDKHRLIIDEYAAEIVRRIFYAKLQGYSQQTIADELNSEGVLSPAEYKKQQGLNYKSGFCSSETSSWNASTITLILNNRLYVGELTQGKRGTPNFKIKKVQTRDPKDWTIVPNAHEAIIDPLIFDVIQRAMERDTRTSPDGKAVFPLSGFVFCSDCERQMVLRPVTRGKKKHYYYMCSTYKRKKGCTSHNFEKSKLEATVLNAVQMQIQTVVELNKLMESIHASDLHAARVRKIQVQLDTKAEELNGYKEFKNSLYEALQEGLIDRDEFSLMRDKYRAKEQICNAAMDALHEKLAEISSDHSVDCSWVEQYVKYQDVPNLTREIVVSLIDKVIVHEDKRIEILFNFQDEFTYCSELVQEHLKEVG